MLDLYTFCSNVIHHYNNNLYHKYIDANFYFYCLVRVYIMNKLYSSS